MELNGSTQIRGNGKKLHAILKGKPSVERFERFERLLMGRRRVNQQKRCAIAAPILQSWPWEIRKLNPRTYWIDAESGVLACTGHLHFERMELYTGGYLEQFILHPDAIHLRGLSFQSIESPPAAFHWLTRSPQLRNIRFLSIRKAELSELAACLGGDALVALEELVIHDDLPAEDLDLLPTLPLLTSLKRLSTGLQYGMHADFLQKLMHSACWPHLERLQLRSHDLTREKVDALCAHWVHPGPQRIDIQNTPAAQAPNPAWAEVGIRWAGEATW